MPTGFTTRFEHMKNRAELALQSADIRWGLLRSTGTYSFNPDHDFVSDIFSNGGVEITVPSYGRIAAAGKAVTLDDATDRTVWTMNSINFGTLEAGQSVSAFFMYQHVTNDSDSPYLFFCDGKVRIYTAAPVAAPTTANITGATQANPVVISSAGHPFINGNKVKITGIVGMTQLNNRIFTVAGAVAGVSYQLTGEDGTTHTAYVSGGVATLVRDVYVQPTRDSIMDATAISFGGVTGVVNGNWPAGSKRIEVADLSAGIAHDISADAQSQVVLPANLGGGIFSIGFNAAGFMYNMGGL